MDASTGQAADYVYAAVWITHAPLLLHACSGGGIGLLVVGNLRITSTADVCPVLLLPLLL